ncbi:PD-(D/E)XK nuclease family protein [Limnochorda pilosa]|uniref:PD-(D/E)XK endonuclease-like domain-containing protein n=1 Tax=Limnochorda pilosa TaxID=1555112 RepID=A0A0K2SHU7_LIMPI|nr:PD-(D/E)XK nuclease family protein [Limnochorda pilosa]BAS26686.1 hypothetical protein LIP_0829 [Limnochorda pilosa]
MELTPRSWPHLEEILRQEPGRRYVLLVRSRPAGDQMLERLARQGVSWANVRVRTPGDLALELAAPELARRGLERATRGQSLYLVDELVRSGCGGGWFLRRAGQPPNLAPEAPASPTDGLVRAVHRSLMELRLHGLSAASLDPSAFSPPAKGEALARLLAAYEDRLAQLSLVDEPGVLRLAVDQAPSDAGEGAHGEDGPLCLVPAGLELLGLERELVRRAGRGRVARFAPGRGGPRTIGFFHATGPEAELRSVLRRVLAGGVPLDQVEVVATDGAAYAEVLHALAVPMGIPVTFAGGLGIEHTSPGRGALAYLDWIIGGYPAGVLARALASGDLAPGPAATGFTQPSGTASAGRRAGDRARSLADRLLESPIGWGRERYRAWVDGHRLRRPARGGHGASGASGEPDRDLAAFLEELLALTPDAAPGRGVGMGGVARALHRVVTRFTVERSPLDRGGRAALLQALEGLERIAARAAGVGPAGGVSEAEAAVAGEDTAGAELGTETLERVAGRLRAWIAALRVGQGEPRPGTLHLAGLEQGGYSGRPHVFLVGLDEGRFPGRGGQDPLLLEGDRSRLPGGLPLAGERMSAHRKSLQDLLDRLEGSLTCSYSSWDPLNAQEVAPSAALLELFRRSSGRADADYSALREALGPPDGVVPAGAPPALDRSEAWLAAIAVGPPESRRLAHPGEGLARAFPLLAAGQEAAAARASDRLTPHDGQIEPEADLDPRRTGQPVSAGRLETLAGCPLRYFFRYVLEVAPPERPQLDPDRWLDPLSRGGLLHQIYRAFLEERIGSGRAGAPIDAADRARMGELARDAAGEMRLRVPPPSEGVFERERRELVDEALFFVSLEAGREDGGVPVLLERAFGMEGEPPVELDLAGDPARPEVLRLLGRIDRIDRLPDGYAVWDYKTGAATRYESERTHLDGGRQLQPVLYAWAAEAILRRAGIDPDPQVRRSGYLMTSRRGRGQRLDRPQDPARREAARALLRRLLDVAAAGTFAPAPDADRQCPFCDYRSACDGPEAVRRVRAKAEAGEARLALWEEVRRYE